MAGKLESGLSSRMHTLSPNYHLSSECCSYGNLVRGNEHLGTETPGILAREGSKGVYTMRGLGQVW